MKLFKSICCIFLAAWLPSILLAAPEEVKMFPTDLIEGIPSIPETFTRIPGAGPDGSCVLRKVRSEIGEYNCLQLPLEGLTAGKMYRLSLWVRQSDISKENTGIFNLEFYDRGTFSQYQTIAIDKGSRDWREVVLEFALYDTPYDRAMMVFYLDRSATGTYEVAMPQLTEMELTLPEQRVQEFSDLNAAGLPEAARKTLEGIRDRYIEKMIRPTPSPAYIAERGNSLEWRGICSLFQTAKDFESLRQELMPTPDSSGRGLLLGFAYAAEKVMPYAPQMRSFPREIVVSAARNEHESFQIVTVPLEEATRKVSVTFSSLVSERGDSLTGAIQAFPVGFVNVENSTEMVGYWPDPIMEHLTEVDEISAGVAQPFWCRLSVPETQEAGIYRGDILVNVDGDVAFKIPLTVRIYDFTLPRTSMLPIAASLIRKPPHPERWNDILADYYITPTNLYWLQGHTDDPDYYNSDLKVMAELKLEDKLGFFNLGYCDPASPDPADRHGLQFNIDKIRPRYEAAKESGLLEHAYIYGCDETQNLADTEKAAEIMKEEFPEVKLLTTSFSELEKLDSWDWYCAQIVTYENYGAEKIAALREKGKQVWWYISCVPDKPYPNIFVDQAGIDIRLLMGLMTFMYKPDGFLYYRLDNWGEPWNPVNLGNEVFTEADPFIPSLIKNGDGCCFYRGPDGIPLPTIRIEAFRDGLEDYAYLQLLSRKIELAEKNVPAADPWLIKAKEALTIPPDLVAGLSTFSRDSELLSQYRDRIASLLELAPF